MPARHTMYSLMVLSQVLNWLMRVGLPQLVPFIVADLGLAEMQRGLLLGSFFPSYVVMQVPAAMLERLTGAKALIVANLLGVGGCLLAMPAAAAHSIRALTLLQALMGAFAGLLFPVQKVLLRDWAPVSLGTERVWALRASAFGMQAGIVGATFFTPLIASGQAGWRAVPRLYGSVTVLGALLWQLLATNSPKNWSGINSDELALLLQDEDGESSSSGGGGGAKEPSEPLPLEFLVRPPVLATFWVNVADNASMYTLQQWAAVWFMEVHKVSATKAGSFLAVANVVNVAGQFISAAVETVLLRSGHSLVSVRRLGGGIGSIVQAVCIALFGLAPTPFLGSLIFSVHNLAESFTSNAYEANYIEFGGTHCAALYGVGNALANIPGFAIAALGALVRARTGSLLPLFGGLAVFQALGGVAYGRLATTQQLRKTKRP